MNCRSPGKHPREDGWQEKATTDEETIRAWWGKWPRANIGIPTGSGAGFWGLDVDPRHGGDDTLAELERKHGRLPHTPEVLSGGSGRHVLFECLSPIPNKVSLGPGLDVKGDGGLIVGAGSVHLSGRKYEWEASSHPDEVPYAETPAWLLKLIQQPEKSAAPSASEVIKEGARNNELASIAGSMRRRGLTAKEIEPTLQAVNELRCVPPLEREEVSAIAASIGTYTPSEATPWRVEAKAEAFTRIDPLRIIDTDPPRYEVTVLGKQIELSLNEFSDFRTFKRACIAKLRFVPLLPRVTDAEGKPVRSQLVWEQEFLGPALARSREQNLVDAAPDDASAFGAAWQSVLLFFSGARKAENRDEVYDDRLFRDDDAYLFRGRVLRHWLARNRYDILKPDELWAMVRSHGGQPKTVRTVKGAVKVWEVPIPQGEDEK